MTDDPKLTEHAPDTESPRVHATGAQDTKHDPSGHRKARSGAFRLAIAATLAAFAIVVGLSLLPGVGTYAEGWVLAAELGVIVMFLAGAGWLLATTLRRR